MRIVMLILACSLNLFSAAGGLLAENLVAHYPFNGNAEDESGNGLNGSVYGATLTQDRFGHENSAYYFNGTTAYIQVANNSVLNPASAVSVSAWVNVKTMKSYAGIVSNIWDTYTNESGYGLCFNDYTTRIGFIASTAGVSSWWSSGCYVEPVQDKWIHLTGVYGDSTASIYADGILIRSIEASGNIQYGFPNSLWIGRYHDDNEDYYFHGSIDDIRIYNKALSAAEVYNIYASEWIIPPVPVVVYSGTGPDISWGPVANANSYTVYSAADPYAEFPAGWTVEVSGITSTSWNDTNAGTSAKKFYRVVAVN